MSSLFNKVIRGRQFNFQSIEFNNEIGYHVDVKDEEGMRWEFRVFPGDDMKGVLHGENLPDWILQEEAEILKAVREFE